jgi:hypothetical protein
MIFLGGVLFLHWRYTLLYPCGRFALLLAIELAVLFCFYDGHLLLF